MSINSLVEPQRSDFYGDLSLDKNLKNKGNIKETERPN